jgi:hypothetical protein
MPNKFLSFLTAAGKFLEHAAEFLIKPQSLMVEGGILTIINPAAGSIFMIVANSIIQTEQAFAAAGNQSGSGPLKFEAVVKDIGPVLAKIVPNAEVSIIINSIVAFLNSLPAPNLSAM